MAQKTLNAYVVISGKVDNSFTQLGQAFLNLGGHIDEISQKLINFGKESVQTYRSYEDSMLEAQTALATTYGKGSQALKAVMKDLDRSASEWAANSIFHTDDVANAIAEAAHANWDLEKILEGMPAAMRLAQAGGLDLSTGLDFIIKSTNAAKISFSDLSEWVDEWTYAANSSAGDVEQFGEAMLRMGATMRFADNKEELLTMLAVLHDAGTVGSNAGTLLRNTLIRLVSPTKKANDAMEELGVTQEDIDEAMGEVSGDTKAAMERLKKAGFSVYKTGGQLKDFTEIFEDLNAATANMSEQEKYDIWSALFPTRTITGAIALMESAGNNWNGLLDDLNGGAAENYGEYAAETMMSGLTGSIETFLSKVEDLRKDIGQNLSPEVQTIADNLGKVIDKIRGGGQDNGVSSGLEWLTDMSGIVGDLADNIGDMDPAVFDALVSGLGKIAVAGPFLTIAGLGIRGIGTALSLFTGSLVGKLILAGIGIGIIVTALKKYSEAKYLEKFGNLQIDTTNLDKSMADIGKAFEKATAPTNAFAEALETSVANYETASEKFSATMMEDLLKDQTLTGSELEKKLKEYETLGSDMVKAVKDGITSSADMSAEFWASVFKGKGQTDEDVAGNQMYQGILKALELEKGEAVERAESIGEELQAAITKAWEDGNLDEGEREKIKEYFRQLNEAMAEAEMEARNEADYVKRKELMSKAQGLSYAQLQEYVTGTIMPQRQEELDWYDSHYRSEIYRMEYRRGEAQKKYDALMAQGKWQEAQKYGQEMAVYDQAIANGKQAIESTKAGIYSNYDQMILSWYAGVAADSDFAEAAKAAETAAGWLSGGTITDIYSLAQFVDTKAKGQGVSDLLGFYETELAALGGAEEIRKRIAIYNESGDEDLLKIAKNMELFLNAYAIMASDAEQVASEVPQSVVDNVEELADSGYYEDVISTYLDMLASGAGSVELNDFLLSMGSGNITKLNEMIAEYAGQYDMASVYRLLSPQNLPENFQDDFALAMLLGMSESERGRYRIGAEASQDMMVDEAKAQLAAAQGAYETAYAKLLQPDGTLAGSEAQIKELENLKMKVNLAEQAVKEAETARALVQAEFDPPIEGNVQLSVSWMDGGGANSGSVIPIPHEASGGRETRPALFAEAGIPEWFIPEEHTANTGRLLLAAMASSGFDLIELAAMSGARMFAEGGTTGALNWGSLAGSGSGGGGSSGGGSGIQVQYSPVIHADNAAGVARALKEDKERLARWFEEFMERRELYESMVAYR